MTLLLFACATAPEPTDDKPPRAALPDDTVTGDDGTPTDTDTPGDTDETAPAEYDDAAVLLATFPTTLACGEAYDAVVTMQNTGTSTWTRAGLFKLGGVDDQDDFTTNARVDLLDTDVVAPGERITFVVPLVAPAEPGTYTTDWRMVHEYVNWFGEVALATVSVECAREAPDMFWVVEEVHDEDPELIKTSCIADGGNWDFMDKVVDRLREHDTRWGYNWKRMEVGNPSEDCVNYFFGEGEPEGSTEVYTFDIIAGHCGPDPQPAWQDVTLPVEEGGAGAMWTGRGRF
ncbi:MAG: NBR1-Ig-like domain-containing protein [Myxococcota bacterium]